MQDSIAGVIQRELEGRDVGLDSLETEDFLCRQDGQDIALFYLSEDEEEAGYEMLDFYWGTPAEVMLNLALGGDIETAAAIRDAPGPPTITVLFFDAVRSRKTVVYGSVEELRSLFPFAIVPTGSPH
jgi:hypothetical protein